jgi:hypothetical protein
MKKPIQGVFILIFASIVFISGSAWGGSDDIVVPTDPAKYLQSNFRDFSKEAGLAISYLPLAPAEPLGITGFDIGGEITLADIDQNKAYWTGITSDNSPPSLVPLAKIHVQKGLPFGFDVGIIYSQVPSSNISLIGGEVKWAFLRGNLLMPALAIRGSYTTLLGVSNLDINTYGVDLSISKGFTFITPYAGIGEVWIQSKPQNTFLTEESLSLTKGFVGIKITLLLVNFVAQADFSTIPLYSARLNIGF